MIKPELIINLDNTQLREFRRFDMSCADLDCVECPLGLEPTEVTLKSGVKYTYRCATAFASYVYSKNR